MNKILFGMIVIMLLAVSVSAYTEEDFRAMGDNFGVSGCDDSNLWCDGADLDGDGYVSIGDLTMFSQNYQSNVEGPEGWQNYINNIRLKILTYGATGEYESSFDLNNNNIIDMQDYNIYHSIPLLIDEEYYSLNNIIVTGVTSRFGAELGDGREVNDYVSFYDGNNDEIIDVNDFVYLRDALYTYHRSFSAPVDQPLDDNIEGEEQISYTDADLRHVSDNFGRIDCALENSWCDGADLNMDGVVDLQDVSIVSAGYREVINKQADNFGRTDCTLENSWCDGADWNNDGIVSIGDLVMAVETKT